MATRRFLAMRSCCSPVSRPTGGPSLHVVRRWCCPSTPHIAWHPRLPTAAKKSTYTLAACWTSSPPRLVIGRQSCCSANA